MSKTLFRIAADLHCPKILTSSRCPALKRPAERLGFKTNSRSASVELFITAAFGHLKTLQSNYSAVADFTKTKTVQRPASS